MKRIKISDGNETLEVSFLEILYCLGLQKDVYWSLLWIDGFGNTQDCPIIEFEKEVNRAKVAKIIDFNALIKLSKENIIFVNVILIGDKNIQNIKDYDKNQINSEISVNYRIELLDSSYWLIDTLDDDFIFRIFKTFKNVEYEKN